jgi:hypothetical protein
MSDEKARAGEKPTEATPPAGLGLLFIAAALALALVLSFVALLAYVAFSPRAPVNPPARPAPAKSSPEGNLRGEPDLGVRRT